MKTWTAVGVATGLFLFGLGAGSCMTEEPSPDPTATVTVTDTERVPQTDAIPSEEAGTYYENCSQARAAGAAPLHRGSPGYRTGLDRDGDGIACDR